MSLTSFLKLPDVRERFRSEFPIPGVRIKGEILAPPVSRRRTLIGTAFDYLLRFYVHRLNRYEVLQPPNRRWVAEGALEYLDWIVIVDVVGKDGRRTLMGEEVEDLADRARAALREAKALYRSYVRTGELTDELIASTVRLAHLESFYRSDLRVIGDPDDVSEEDIEDLRRLIAVAQANEHLFRASRACLLNPTFGRASEMIGGADADIIVDGTLVEIKTTTVPKVDRNWVYQLVGYYILSRVCGIDGLHYTKALRIRKLREPWITRLGVYFARFGHMETWDVDEIVNRERFPEFVRWFCDRAQGRGL